MFEKNLFMTLQANRNEKQLYFNQIRGKITELNPADLYCSITLEVGHENLRLVNFIIRKTEYDKEILKHKIGDMVCIYFYVSSRNKNGRWYTAANILQIEKC